MPSICDTPEQIGAYMSYALSEIGTNPYRNANAHPTDLPLLDVEFWTHFGEALLELASRPGVCTEEFLAVAYQLQQAVMASQMRQ
ncbi:hypothetical protein IWQ60_005575, partial [Tieghemiomyces parasiticus]